MSNPQITTARTHEGDIVTATEAQRHTYYFCLACDFQVRVHKRRSPNGPADHFEHTEKRRCKLIKYP